MARQSASQKIRTNLLRRIRYYERQGYVFNRSELLNAPWQRQRTLSGRKLTAQATGFRLQNNDVVSIASLKEYQRAAALFNALARPTSTRAELYTRLPYATSAKALQDVTQSLRARSNVGYFTNRANVLISNYLRTLAFIPDEETANALYFHIMNLPTNEVIKKILDLQNQGSYGISAGTAFDSNQGVGVADVSSVLRYWGLNPDDYETDDPWSDEEIEDLFG